VSEEKPAKGSASASDLPESHLPQSHLPQSHLPQSHLPQSHLPRPILPRPIIRKMRWPFPLIWLVPIAAAGLAGYYAWEHHREQGPEITIHFNDASGLKADESQVIYRGVEIGEVESLSLSPDAKSAIVRVQLRRDQYPFAERGAEFWIVRPEISETSVSGLSTIISGPFIQAKPGSGDSVSDFVGQEREPIQDGPGVKVILHTPHMEHLQLESPVYFRGLQVGLIQDIRFASDSTEVNVTVLIWKRYQNLLRTNSVFWTEKGADIKGGIFSGIKIDLKSLHEILTGGIVFATPDHPGRQAEDGESFPLHDEVNKDWLDWSPQIPLEQAPSTSPAIPPASTSGQNSLSMQVKKQ
jgi:paraquat-inducible protein B